MKDGGTAHRDEAADFLAQHPDTVAVDAMVPDLGGVIRGKRLPVAELPKLFSEGLQLPASVFLMDATGTATGPLGRGISDGDPDYEVRAIPGSIAPVPWAPEPRAQVLCTMFDENGRPDPNEPRNVLSRVAARFRELDLVPVVAVELEFYLIDRERAEGGAPQPPRAPATGHRDRETQVYSLGTLDDYDAFLSDLMATCAAQNIPAGAASAEYAPGQFEINLGHLPDPQRAGDHAVLLRRAVKGVARRHGMDATFMPRPYLEYAGSGMHIHLSLADGDGRNVFADSDPHGNAALRHAVGGILATMAEGMAVLAPGANAYRRFQPNLFVPLAPNWGANNRAVAVRIPGGPAASRRLEHRVAGADANPYLALAVTLAGAHYGIANEIDPGPPTGRDESGDIRPELPLRWPEALERFAKAEILPEYLGREYATLYRLIREAELEKYDRHIPPVEFDWYL